MKKTVKDSCCYRWISCIFWFSRLCNNVG